MTKREKVISLFRGIGDSLGRRIILTKYAVTDKELEDMISSGKVEQYEVERSYPRVLKWLKDKGYIREGVISSSVRNAIRDYWTFNSEERIILRKSAEPYVEPPPPKISKEDRRKNREKIRQIEPSGLAIWFSEVGYKNDTGCFNVMTKTFLYDVESMVKVLWSKFGIWSKPNRGGEWYSVHPAVYIPRMRIITQLAPRHSARAYHSATIPHGRHPTAQEISKDSIMIYPAKEFQQIIAPFITDPSIRERKLFPEWLDTNGA